MRSGYLTANGIRFHLLTDGEGPLVLLLHGFPQTSHAWHDLLPRLATHGYRVAAPDLRGYGGSSRPTRIRDYRTSKLGDDVAALIAALGEKKAHVIGHDWGGAAAWETALAHPEVVDRLVVMNAPPAEVLARALRSSLRQMRRSWYIFFFALPGLPERFLTRRHGEILARFFEGGGFSDEDLELYRDAICQPGAAISRARLLPRRGAHLLRRRSAPARQDGRLPHPRHLGRAGSGPGQGAHAPPGPIRPRAPPHRLPARCRALGRRAIPRSGGRAGDALPGGRRLARSRLHHTFHRLLGAVRGAGGEAIDDSLAIVVGVDVGPTGRRLPAHGAGQAQAIGSLGA